MSFILLKRNRFNKYVTFALIESITNTNKPKEAIQELLKIRENFWIRTLETLELHELNHELNPQWLYPAITLFKFKFVVRLELQFG